MKHIHIYIVILWIIFEFASAIFLIVTLVNDDFDKDDLRKAVVGNIVAILTILEFYYLATT